MIYTKSGTHIATGYRKIVDGDGKNKYYEIPAHKIVLTNLIVPANVVWRCYDKEAYYVEFRSHDSDFIKIYDQKRKVRYADYIPGFFYVNIEDVKLID